MLRGRGMALTIRLQILGRFRKLSWIGYLHTATGLPTKVGRTPFASSAAAV